MYVSTADSASSRIRIRGIDGDRASERRALLLAAGQRDATLPDQRVEAMGKVGDVLVEPRRRRGVGDAPCTNVILYWRWGPTPSAN